MASKVLGIEQDCEPHEDDGQDAADAATEALLTEVDAALPEGFELGERDIMRLHNNEERVHVCAPIHPVVQARHGDGTGWCHLVRFLAADDSLREAIIPARQLVANPTQALAALVDQGFQFRGRAGDICALIQRMASPVIAEAVDVTGWVGRAFDTYVMANGKTLAWTGNAVEESPARAVFTGRPRQRVAHYGTLEEWSRNVVGTDPENTPVVIGACIAFAPAILSHTGNPSFLLHLSGNTTAQAACRAVAASAWGEVGALEISWERPAREIVAEIARARDGLLILSGYEPHHARKVEAVSTALAAQDGDPQRGGRVVILSTGAVPLKDPNNQHGLSDLGSMIDLDTSSWPSRSAEDAIAASSEFYGTFGPAAVSALIKYKTRQEGDLESYLDIRSKDILQQMRLETKTRIDAETSYVSTALGTLFSAGHFMMNRKVLLWGKPRAPVDVLGAIAQDWRRNHLGGLDDAGRALLMIIADRVAELSQDGLEPLESPEIAYTTTGPGWQDDSFFYLTTATIADIARQANQPLKGVIARLKAQGLLHPGSDRGDKFRMTSRIAGRPRAYRVSRELLSFAENLPQ